MTTQFVLDLSPEEQAELNAPVDAEVFGSVLMRLTGEQPLSSHSLLALITPDHPMRGCFEWNDRRGAARWRFVNEGYDEEATDAWACESWRHRQVGILLGNVTITIDEDDPIPLFGPPVDPQ